MGKEPRPLAEAQERVSAMITDLAPYCERVEPAGSVRRQKSMVGDLELVAIPRHATSGGLFNDQDVNLLWEYLQENPRYTWLKGNNADGKYFQLATADGWQLDLFTAEPDNYGWILLMRTGSADFSHSILARHKRLQGIGKDNQGSIDGRLVHRDGSKLETPEEDDVFKAVHLSYMDPRTRTEPVR